MNWKRALWGAWVLPVALAADRLTKAWAAGSLDRPQVWIPSVLGARYAQNTGAAFSMLSGSTYVVTAITVLLIAGVTAYLLAGKHVPKAARLGLWLVVAGGAGNLFDRLFYGYVVDFIEVLFMKFAIFNVADVCVCCGAALAALAFLLTETKENGRKAE